MTRHDAITRHGVVTMVRRYAFVRRRTQLDAEGRHGIELYESSSVRWAPDGQIIERRRIITQREFRVCPVAWAWGVWQCVVG